jgi:hypothetical protein
MVYLIAAVTVGCLLGIRYTFFSLIPMTILAAAAHALMATFNLENWSAIWTASFLSACALQCGYIIGLTLREYAGQQLPSRSGGTRSEQA